MAERSPDVDSRSPRRASRAARVRTKMSEEERRQERERIAFATNKSPSAEADVVIVVGGRPLVAHRAILNVRCPNIFVFHIKKKTIKKATITLEIDERSGITRNAMEALLKFSYSANVQFFGLEAFEIVQLYHVAKIYEVMALKELSLAFLYYLLDSNNFFQVFKEADKLNCDEAKTVCKDYGRSKFSDIVSQKEGCVALGIHLFHELAAFVALVKTDYRPPMVEDVVRESYAQIKDDFKKIFQENFNADTIFKIEDEPILCHSYIVIECPELKKVLEKGKSNIELPGKYKEMPRSAFLAFLKFIYFHPEEDIDPLIARQLKAFSEEFGLVRLRDVCEHMIKCGITDATAVEVLKLANNYQKVHRHKDTSLAIAVEKKCLELIMTRFDRVDFSALVAEAVDSNAAVDILENVKHQMENGNWRRMKHQKTKVLLPPQFDTLVKPRSPPSPSMAIPAPVRVAPKAHVKRPKSTHNTPSKRYTLQSGQLSKPSPKDLKKSTSEGQVPKMGNLDEVEGGDGAIRKTADMKKGIVVLGATQGDDKEDESSEEDVEVVEDDEEGENGEMGSQRRVMRKLEREHSDPAEHSMRFASPRRPDEGPPTAISMPVSLSSTSKTSTTKTPSISSSPKLPTKYVPPTWSTRNKSQREVRLNLAPTPPPASPPSAPPKEMASLPSSRMAARLVNGKWVVSAPEEMSPREASSSQPTAIDTLRAQRLRERFERDPVLTKQPSSSTSS